MTLNCAYVLSSCRDLYWKQMFCLPLAVLRLTTAILARSPVRSLTNAISRFAANRLAPANELASPLSSQLKM